MLSDAVTVPFWVIEGPIRSTKPVVAWIWAPAWTLNGGAGWAGPVGTMSNARLVALRLLVMSVLAKLPMLVRNEPTFTLAVGTKIIPPGEDRNIAPMAVTAPSIV